MPTVRVRPAMSSLQRRGSPRGVLALEHSADTGIEAHGRTLEQCFARAAAGLFAILFDPAPPDAPRRRVEITVESADGTPELMVAWLEELLYRSDSERLAFDRFEVAEVSATRVSGSALGSPFESLAGLRGPIVKGVTRHGLEVAQHQAGWTARIYFDV